MKIIDSTFTEAAFLMSGIPKANLKEISFFNVNFTKSLIDISHTMASLIFFNFFNVFSLSSFHSLGILSFSNVNLIDFNFSASLSMRDSSSTATFFFIEQSEVHLERLYLNFRGLYGGFKVESSYLTIKNCFLWKGIFLSFF